MTDDAKPYLVITEEIDGDAAQELRMRLEQYAELGETRILVRKALGIPQYIELIGTIAFWTPISIAVAAFLKKIASRSADDLYDYLKGRLKGESDNIAMQISESLYDFKKNSTQEISIHLSLVNLDNTHHLARRIRFCRIRKKLFKICNYYR